MLEKKQIIFLLFIDLIAVYFIAGVVVFFLNGYSIRSMDNLLIIKEYYGLKWTFLAIVNNVPKIYEAIFYTFLAVTPLVVIIPFLPKRKSLHGNAKFANDFHIKNKMKLFNEKGLIIGKKGNKFLRANNDSFIALGAPTRSGKGVSVVIPNLLDWKESVVVLDIKQECFEYTSKYRKEVLKQDVFLFDPFSFRTHRYNPLSYIDLENDETRDKNLLDFANLLYPLVGTDITIYFNQLAQNLFIGLCYLYKDLQFSKEGKEFLDEYNLNIEFTMYGILSLSEGFEIIQESEENLDNKVEEQEESQIISGLEEFYEFLVYLNILSEETKERLSSYINIKSVNTKSSVESSFKAPLMIYRSEPIRSATSCSDFDLNDLRKRRITVYIGITPNNLANARPILNILFSQLISLNTTELPSKNKDLKYTCLLLWDEFTSIGNMPILLKSVSYIAGYNLRLMTVFQSISQLEAPSPDGYGKEGAKTILNNHILKIFFAPDSFDEAEILSKRLGDTTVKVTSKSHSSGKGFLESGSYGRNISEQRRSLMLPQELIELGVENEIITMNNEKTILCKKAFYYKEQYFMDKFKTVSKSLKRIKGLPSKIQLENAVNNDELNIKIPNIKEKK